MASARVVAAKALAAAEEFIFLEIASPGGHAGLARKL